MAEVQKVPFRKSRHGVNQRTVYTSVWCDNYVEKICEGFEVMNAWNMHKITYNDNVEGGGEGVKLEEWLSEETESRKQWKLVARKERNDFF